MQDVTVVLYTHDLMAMYRALTDRLAVLPDQTFFTALLKTAIEQHDLSLIQQAVQLHYQPSGCVKPEYLSIQDTLDEIRILICAILQYPNMVIEMFDPNIHVGTCPFCHKTITSDTSAGRCAFCGHPTVWPQQILRLEELEQSDDTKAKLDEATEHILTDHYIHASRVRSVLV